MDNAGDLQIAYIHGPMIDEILAKIDNAGTVYYHHDGLGSTIALTDNTSDPVETYTYDVFGTVTILDPSTLATRPSTLFGNRFLFTGREWIAEVGFYDYRNRVYSGALGRFLQTDPIRFDAGDVNLYRYVANNPVNWMDPQGLCWNRTQAFAHYLRGGGDVSLSQTGCVGQVTASIKNHLSSLKEAARNNAEAVAAKMSCPEAKEKTFSGTVPQTGSINSGVWWIGGISLKRYFVCTITPDCSTCTYSYTCRLIANMRDPFEKPFKLRSKQSPFDNIEVGSRYFVSHTWDSETSGEGSL